MSLFKEVQGDSAIISSGGVYRQCNLYVRDDYLFAEISNGRFIRLKADGSTSKPNTTLIHLETTLDLHRDRFNRLGTKKIKDAVKLDQPSRVLLTSE